MPEATVKRESKHNDENNGLRFRATQRMKELEESSTNLEKNMQKHKPKNMWQSTKRFIKTATINAVMLASMTQLGIAYNSDNSYQPVTPAYSYGKIPYPKTYQPYIRENLQMVEFIDKNITKIEVTFNAISQKGSNTDNRILINGLTDKGWWYQYGVMVVNHNNKTALKTNYEFWDDKGRSIYPYGGKSGIMPLWGTGNPGDKFNLSLEIKNGLITCRAIDLATGAHNELVKTAMGSTFVGTRYPDRNGYSTSIFREMWVDQSFDTSTITPQIITVVSPKLERASLYVKKGLDQLTQTGGYLENKRLTNVAYCFDNINLNLKPIYLKPINWIDRGLEHMWVAAYDKYFYTTGGR